MVGVAEGAYRCEKGMQDVLATMIRAPTGNKWFSTLGSR